MSDVLDLIQSKSSPAKGSVKCSFCGDRFAPTATQKKRIAKGEAVYCSKLCINRRRAQTPNKRKVCKRCGSEFMTQSARQIHCGKDCYKASETWDRMHRTHEEIAHGRRIKNEQD